MASAEVIRRHPHNEGISSEKRSEKVPAMKDAAMCDLFAVAMTGRVTSTRIDCDFPQKFNASVNIERDIHPEKSQSHAAVSIKPSTKLNAETSAYQKKQETFPLCSNHRTIPLHAPLQRTLLHPQQDPPLTHPPLTQNQDSEDPNQAPTSSSSVKTHFPKPQLSEIKTVFNALLHQLHLIQFTLNAHRRSYSNLKTYHHKALVVFCTGGYEGWAQEEARIERRMASISRALREDRRWEEQIVEKLGLLEEILEEKGQGVDSWRRPAGIERWRA